MTNAVEYSIQAKDEFTAEMKRMNASVAAFDKEISQLKIGAVIYETLKMAKASLENAEAMGTQAEKAGMTTEAFSALSWAAKMSNVEANTLTSALRMLGKSLADSDATPAGKALAKMGVSAKDAGGNIRPTIDILLDLADKFASTKDGAEQAKNASDLFGRKIGTDMLPFLHQGSAAIREMMDNAKKFGVVITDDFAKSADQVNDNLTTMADIVKGSFNVAMTSLAPVLEELTGLLIDFTANSGFIQDFGNAVAAGFRVALSAIVIVTAAFRVLGQTIAAIVATNVQIMNGDFVGAFHTVKQAFIDGSDTINAAVTNTSKIWDESAQSAAAASARQMTAIRKAADAMAVQTKADEDARKEREKLTKSIDDSIKSMLATIMTTGMTSSETKVYELSLKGATGAQLAHAKSLATIIDAQANFKEQLSEATSIISSQQTPLEKHLEMLDKINSALENGAVTVDDHARMIRRESAAWDDARFSTEQYKNTADDSMEVAGKSIYMHMRSLGSVSYQIGTMISDVFFSVVRGIGDATADAIIEGKDLSESFTQIGKQILKTIISTFIQIGVQRALLSAGIITAYSAEAAASTGATGVMVAGGTATSIAWGPVLIGFVAVAAAIWLVREAVQQFGPVGVATGIAVSIAWAPAAAVALSIAAAVWLVKAAFEELSKLVKGESPTIVSALSPILWSFALMSEAIKVVIDLVNKLIDAIKTASGAIGGIGGDIANKGVNVVTGGGSVVSNISDALSFDGGGFTGYGSRSGGIDGRGGFAAILHPNETVIDHDKNQSSGGSVVIQNLTIHIMENAVNADVFANMDRIQLRNAIGRPVVDALNEMFAIGVRPDFASQKV